MMNHTGYLRLWLESAHQYPDNQLICQFFRQCPINNTSGVQVHHSSHIEPLFLHMNIDNIGGPDDIAYIDFKILIDEI